MTSTFKLVGACLLLVALILPQYTCGKYHDPQGQVVSSIPDGVDSKGYTPFQEKHYAWENTTWEQPSSWIAPALFLWPLLLLPFRIRAKRSWARRLVFIIEPLLFAASMYVVWELSKMGERAVGAYVGIAGNVVYGLGWLRELRSLWPRRGRA